MTSCRATPGGFGVGLIDGYRCAQPILRLLKFFDTHYIGFRFALAKECHAVAYALESLVDAHGTDLHQLAM